MPRVSILLPLTAGMEEHDFVFQTIDSILHQTYSDFELLISECDYSKNDSRIKTFQHGAEEELITSSSGEFILSIDENSLLNHYYLENLLKPFSKNPKLGMVYSNGKLLNSNSKTEGNLILNDTGVYNSRSYYRNFCKAVSKRVNTPTVFGLFKKEVYRNLYEPDRDLLIPKLFLHKYKTRFVNKSLFYYHKNNGSAVPDSVPNNPIGFFLYGIWEQLNFFQNINKTITKKYKGKTARNLKTVTLDSCLNHCVDLLPWIATNLVKDAFEYSLLQELSIQFNPIYKMRIRNIYEKPTDIDCNKNIRIRCKILKQRVLPQIKEILRDTRIVKQVGNQIDEIANEHGFRV